jgi:hypothetical protein
MVSSLGSPGPAPTKYTVPAVFIGQAYSNLAEIHQESEPPNAGG